MTTVAEAYVQLVPSTRGFGRGVESQVGREMTASGSRLGGVLGGALKVGALAAVGGVLLGGAFLKGALGEAREAQKITAQTQAVIKSTGAAAGVTAKQVGDLAGALSLKTGIDDEVIQSGQNMLLTFKNIRNEAGAGNDIFNQSTKALVDMSAAMGSDPKTAAVQLGKALNDPIKGISALSRVGVQFTDGQKKVIEGMVEGGNVMGAQKVILKELNSQFGGSAAAQATAGDKLRVAWGNLQETVGTALLPLWDRFLGAMTQVTLYLTGQVGPAFAKVSAFIAPMVASIQGAFGGSGGGGGLLAGIQSFATTVTTLFLPVLKTIGTSITTTILPAVTSLATYVGSALVPIFVRIVGIVQSQVLPILASLATFLYGTLVPAIFEIAAAVAGKLKPVFDQWAATFQGKLLPALEQTLTKLREWQPTIQKVVLVVVKIIGKVLEFAAAVLGKVLPVVIRFAGFLLSNVVPAVLHNIEATAKFIGKMIELGSAVVDRIQDFVRFVKGVKEKFGEAIAFVKTIPGKILAPFTGLAQKFYDAGSKLVSMLAEGIRDKAEDAIGALKDLAGKLAGMVPGSPVKTGPLMAFNNNAAGRKLMEMLADGIEGAGPKVLKAMSSTLDKVIDQTTAMRDRIKSNLDGVLSDFTSLRDSIASTFLGDPFNVSAIESSLTDTTFTAAQTVSQAFMNGLADKKGQLKELLKAFKKLKGWGLSSQFLSQMFASGNSALILEMAGGTKASALGSADLFGDVQSLSNQLGGRVARNQYGPQIKRLEDKLDRANKHLKSLDTLAKDIGRELNNAVAHGERKAG